MPAIDAERPSAAAAVVGGVGGRPTDRRRPDPDLRPRRPDRQLGLHPGDDRRSSRSTGLWPETQPAILVLLALAGLFVLVVHDLLPADALGPAKFVVEGSVAITVATLLVALTGGVQSPFFFTFPLIVGGAALVVSPADHGRPGRARPRSATCSRSSLGSPDGHARPGDRGDRRHQPDRADPARLRRDGHRPGAAPDARRGHPPVDDRLADRPVQPRRSSSPRSSARSPAAPGPAAASAC